MTDPSKKLKNPLLSANVTGSTFEDFAQNAVLLPAMEKPKPPPPPIFNPTTLTSHTPTSSAFLEPIRELDLNQQPRPALQQQPLQPPQQFQQPLQPPQQFQQPLQPPQQFQQPPQQPYQPAPTTGPHLFPDDPIISPFQSVPQQPQSHLSSVFSSFSNILKIGSNTTPVAEAQAPIPAPAGLDNFITQENVNAPPVPLFSPSEAPLEPPKPPVNQGPANSFRRSTGLKRPAYAQIPGLTGNAPPVIQPQPAPNQPPLPQNHFQPSVSPSNSIGSSASSLHETPTNFPHHFKPISPLPPNFSNGNSQLNNPQPQFIPSFHPLQEASFSSTNGQFLTPTMANVPVSQSSNDLGTINSMPSDYLSATTRIGQNNTSNQVYRQVYHHWFYKKEVEGKEIWSPFSTIDSLALEHEFTSNDLDPDKVIATDGGRYDVNILRRQRCPVYWKGNPSEVRRCSWFHKKNADGRYLPYEENVATMLEEHYKVAYETNQWHKKIELSNGESVILHGPDVIVLFPTNQVPDAWGNTPNQSRPRIVKRGLEDFDIDEGEPAKVDHLLFMVHGIGSVCDLKFRSVEEVVDEFRSIALQLVQSHYKSSCESGVVNRIEVLPISWHEKLHSEETGVDNQLKYITLESIPKLREFTNGTLLDILFYTSPIYCQTIVSAVGNELNRIYGMYKERNPGFNGGVSLGGHSLGSLILFDLLSHQQENKVDEKEADSQNNVEDMVAPLGDVPTPQKRKISRRISYMMGTAGTGQPQICYPHLNFQPSAFFALGSPIGMFVTVRGLDKLGEQFRLPTCPAFFNIFHPYDPVAYRMEALINSELATLKPVLIPHHKGRKRMHLELKETMARVGADLKQKVFDSMKSTWNSFYQLAMFHKSDQPPSLEEEVSKVFRNQIDDAPDTAEEDPQQEQTDIPLGNLNGGRRIDYVLQEAPFEFFNEYIFALTSHVCYWESEDTTLLMLKEIYSSFGVSTDNQIPQQTMTIERGPPSPKTLRAQVTQARVGMDPTAPIQQSSSIQPPPTSGFFRKS